LRHLRTALSTATIHRTVLAIADQGVSSTINLGFSIVAASSLARSAFGAFALVFATYLILLGLARSCIAAPLGIRFSAVSHQHWHRAASASFGCALLLGFVGALFLIPAGLLTPHDSNAIGSGFIALGVALPGLLAQDQLRFAAFARGKPGRALLFDCIWAATLSLALWILSAVGGLTLPTLIAAWGCAALVSAACGALILNLRPRPASAQQWLLDHRDLSPSLTAEFVLTSGITQVVAFGLGAVSGLAAAGALRGAQVLFGPINVVLMAATAVAVPEGARILRHVPRYFRASMLGVSIATGLSVLGWGLCLSTLIPASLGRTLLGSTWPDAQAVIPALTVLMTLTAIATGALIGLRVLEQPGKSVKARAAAAPLLLLGGLTGATWADAAGAVWGQCLPMAALVIVWWLQFTRASTPPVHR